MRILVWGMTFPLFVVPKNTLVINKNAEYLALLDLPEQKKGASRHVYKKRFATRPFVVAPNLLTADRKTSRRLESHIR